MSYMTTSQSRSISSSRSFYACYCCSRCANPIVTRLTSRMTKSGRTGFFGVTAEELNAQASAEEAVLTGRLLEYLSSPKAESYPEGMIDGLDSPCPVCGNVEAWQTKELLWKVGASGPIQVFNALQASYAWAQRILRARKDAAELAAADPAAMERGQERLREIGEELRACEEEKASGAEARELASLRARETALNEQFKSMSAFNKDKKQVKEELDRCRGAIAEAEGRYQAAVAREDAKAAGLTAEQAGLSLYGKALTDRALLHENKFSLALSLATGGEEKEKTVSLAALPETGRHTVSAYVKEEREMLLQAVKPLNDALLAAQGKEESV